MVGSLNGKIIGPVIVGGKGGLADNEIKIKGNISNIFYANAGLLQAIIYCLRRKDIGVFYAVEAFLFTEGNNFSICN